MELFCKNISQALAAQLCDHHDTTDLADIHLLVKRKLATTQFGQKYQIFSAGWLKYFLPSGEMMKYFLAGGNKQGAEERSSLLNKLLFSEYAGNKKV